MYGRYTYRLTRRAETGVAMINCHHVAPGVQWPLLAASFLENLAPQDHHVVAFPVGPQNVVHRISDIVDTQSFDSIPDLFQGHQVQVIIAEKRHDTIITLRQEHKGWFCENCAAHICVYDF